MLPATLAHDALNFGLWDENALPNAHGTEITGLDEATHGEF
jgi:hypothetical protein